jgi:hypothetical protein
LVEGDISHLRQLQKSLFKSISPTFWIQILPK